MRAPFRRTLFRSLSELAFVPSSGHNTSAMSFLRFLMLLALIVWVGGLIFFPVVAGTAFSVLPSAHLAGLVVRRSLIILHWMGIVSGVVFLAASLVYNRAAQGTPQIFSARHLLVSVMLALTCISQFWIIPRMDSLRNTLGDVASGSGRQSHPHAI